MRVLFSGGGTLGSVTPLIAVVDELRRRHGSIFEALWVATKGGIEQKIVRDAHIPVREIFGYKLRRYISVKTLLELPLFFVALIQAFFILQKWKPEILVSAGGYISVPIHIIGWMLGIPALIHAQDIRAGLANRVMAHFARRVTVAFPVGRAQFGERAELTGNPVRAAIFAGDRTRGFERFHLEPHVPTVLVLGGGTGALSLNRALTASLEDLLRYAQVIHVTGFGKVTAVPQLRGRSFPYQRRYHPFPFLGPELADAYAVADLVVSRAGIGTLSEIAALGLPAVLIPIPSSHQEANAQYFLGKGAAKIVTQAEIQQLVPLIINVLKDSRERLELGHQAQKLARRGATEAVADCIETLAIG